MTVLQLNDKCNDDWTDNYVCESRNEVDDKDSYICESLVRTKCILILYQNIVKILSEFTMNFKLK